MGETIFMEINWNLVALAAGLLFYGMLAAMTMRRPLKAAWGQLRALPRFVQTLLVAMAVVATVEAQKPGNGGGTNEPPANVPGPGGLTAGHRPGISQPSDLRIAERPNAVRPSDLHLLGVGELEPTVTVEEIAQGYRLVSVTNETRHSFVMPTNAVYIGKLHLHGARSDFGRHVVDLDAVGGETTGWAFPYGPSNATTSAFWWFMDGRLQDALCGPAFVASAELGDTLAMQGESRLWAHASEGTRTVTWERFFAGGDTNEAVNAQITLDASGNFTVRSNDLLRVFRRINPNDWDGDGLDNLIDVWPMASDGDCFGTGMNWLNANCWGVLSAVPNADDGYEIIWNANANDNAYFWLTFTPTRDGTRVAIACDGPSNLGDMIVLANEGQLCEVPMLMGARYHLTASWPVGDIAASDPEAVVSLNTVRPSNLPTPGLRLLGAGGGIEPSDDFEVERPVNIDLTGGESGGYITSSPDIGVVIGAVTGSCCAVECTGSNYVWSCCDSCHCSGYSQWWQVTALWEGYSKLFNWESQCGCQRANETNTSAWVSISAPRVIMRGGNSHIVSGVYDPPGSSNAEASMSLECTAGADKITVLSQGSGWMEVKGAVLSDSIDDVEFRLVSEIGGQAYTNTANLTVACVTNLDMTCAFAGTSPNPPPFDGETACPFSITNSLAPDRHLVVPFFNVATLGDNGFSVTNFTVDMNLVLAPTGVNGSSLPCDWELIEAKPQMSGALSHEGGLTAHFVNPTQGGVYRFRGRCDGSPWTEGNVVLPLSGASIDAVFESDFTVYEAAMANLSATSGPLERQTPNFGLRWFNDDGAADYRGRVDNAIWPTVWRYNQVSDLSGFGAVATLYGIPARVSKLGNFFAGYGTRILGVWGVSRWLSQWIGTDNDETAEMSWDAGTDVADGSNLTSRVAMLSTNMWSVSDAKVRTLWPNPAATDNHVVAPTNSVDYNFSFQSPGVVEWNISPQISE